MSTSSAGNWLHEALLAAELTLKIKRVEQKMKAAKKALVSTALGPVEERPVLRPEGSQTSLASTDLRGRHSSDKEWTYSGRAQRCMMQKCLTTLKTKRFNKALVGQLATFLRIIGRSCRKHAAIL